MIFSGTINIMQNKMEPAGGITKVYYESEKWAETVKFWQEYAVLDENGC